MPCFRNAKKPPIFEGLVSYPQHLLRIQTARSQIDMKPSKLMIKECLRIEKLREDHNAAQRITSENIKLIKRLNSLQRRKGSVDCYNTFPDLKRTRRFSDMSLRVEQIENENFELGCRLLTVKSTLNTRVDLQARQSKTKRPERQFPVPACVRRKYLKYIPFDPPSLLEKILRPKIYFDFEVRDLRPLGRVKIQLFVEACPDVVLQFVRLCTHNDLDRLQIIRIFPHLWIESEVTLDQGPVVPRLEYKMRALDHGIGPGVLSFSKKFLSGFPQGLLNYTISAKTLSVLNGERVPFGLVVTGMKIIDIIQDYGTKNGKTRKDIIVSKCGVAD